MIRFLFFYNGLEQTDRLIEIISIGRRRFHIAFIAMYLTRYHIVCPTFAYVSVERLQAFPTHTHTHQQASTEILIRTCHSQHRIDINIRLFIIQVISIGIDVNRLSVTGPIFTIFPPCHIAVAYSLATTLAVFIVLNEVVTRIDLTDLEETLVIKRI